MSTSGYSSTSPTPIVSSQLLMKYEILRKIGEGGFGAVYEVRDRSTNSVWCAKIVPFNGSSTKEVQEMKKFNNPHIIQLREAIADRTAGQMYIIMEYCEGGTLKSWIKRNRKHMMLTEPVRDDHLINGEFVYIDINLIVDTADALSNLPGSL